MLRLVGVLAVFAFGCRIGFDDVTSRDATTGDVGGDLGHDEDSDGIADAEDFCPHIASQTNLDGDGDRVGDLCDPEPTNPAQSWLLFAPMTEDVPNLSHGTQWTLRSDDWQYIDDVDPAQLIRTGSHANVDVWVGFDVTTVGTGGVQAAIVLRNGGATPYFYGELFDGGAGARLSIIEYDGASYNAVSTQQLGMTFPTGPQELHLQARPGGIYGLSLGASSTSAATTATTAMFLLLGFGNHAGAVRYVAIIESQ